ncbi:hypothetical protein WICPIJ_006539 [Wickerhamomyces pijperi]|uniref:Uncharacterized protein n=1 Tax=Wickerhamomyces pijperi TaxID=599730 RepID=A0A9P8Q434_WICPI|nr:hypothetical protein WICPIJ_006539 [Wickerhamomyces pijperi]
MSNEPPIRRSVVSAYLENLENLNQTKNTALPPPSSPTKGLHSRAKSLFENSSPQSVPLSPLRSRSTLVPSSPSRSLTSNISSRPYSILDMPSSPSRLRPTSSRDQMFRPASPVSKSSQPLKLPSLLGSPIKISHSSAPLAGSTAQSGKAFDYLCRVAEAKEWIESIIKEEIPPVGSLIKQGLKDGVVLAKLAKSLKPQIKDKITVSKFQYHHTDNINIFFKLLDEVKMPDLFRFELNDLYESRNIPKIIICLHALTAIVSAASGVPTVIPAQGPFSDEDLHAANTCLRGLNFPNFESLNSQFKRELRGRCTINYEPPKSSAALLNPPVLRPLEKNLSDPSSSPTRRVKSPFLDNDSQQLPPLPIKSSAKSNNIPQLAPAPKLKIPSSPTSRTLNTTLKPIDTLKRDQSMEDFGKKIVEDFERSPSRRKKMSESEFLTNIIKFQAHARGANTRYSFFIKKKMLDIWNENIIDLQSICRRALVLRKMAKDPRSKQTIEPEIIRLQAVIRGKLQRDECQKIRKDESSVDISRLQSVIRGNKVREAVDRINFELFRHESKVVQIQSKIRTNAIHCDVKRTLQSRDNITAFQALARRVLFERKLNKSVKAVHSEKDAVLLLQSIIRGNSVRNQYTQTTAGLGYFECDILELQSIIRGGLLRNKLNHILDTLEDEDGKLNEFSAVVRGQAARDEVSRINLGLDNATDSVIGLQAHIRGVITRYSYDLILDNFDFYAEDVTALQSLIRGYLHRQSRRELLLYYEQFLPQIIKIQSYIRGKYLGTAYKSLISMPNPPLSVIKKFAYLLVDNEVDLQEEVKLTQLKELINEKTSSNERLEKHIDQLNLKIALLEKNKIEFDEVVHQMNKSISGPNSSGSYTTIDLSSLNHKSKTKIELFEKLFYLLQTQPSYLTKLLNLSSNGINIVLKVFNSLKSDGLPTREEYLFIKLMENLIKDAVMKAGSIDNFQRDKDADWTILVNTLVMDSSNSFHRSTFAEIMEVLIEDEDVDFEANPVVIFKRLHGSSYSYDSITENDAISDQSTEKQFIYNLQQLRGYSSEIFHILEESMESIPAFIKILAKTAYQVSVKKYPHYVDQEHLSNAGYVFAKGFFNLMFNPQHFTKFFKSERLTKLNRANLHSLDKLLTQIFIMKPFGSKDPYHQPLNRHIISKTEDTAQFLKSLIEIGDVDSLYQMTIYDDMTAHNRPNLTLNILDMISIGEVIQREINGVAPYRSDSLREVLVAIQSLSTPDLSKLNGYYTLLLNPSVYKPNSDEIRIKALNMQLKRCIVYLIQVQDECTDLRDLLESPIEHIHEFKFKQLIDLENREIQSRRAVNDYVNEGQGSLGDLTKVSYSTLKQITIQRIQELQSLGKLSTSFDAAYQSIINDIANDIKSKNDQRQLRKRQLQMAENAIIRLGDKGLSLNHHLQNYAILIDKSMENMQSKSPSRRKRIIPFTKQYFYERELKRDGRVPRFGAFKYSYKKLYEKGILIIKDTDPLTSSSFFTGLSFPRVDFMFESNEAGVFEISTKSYENSKIAMNGYKEVLTLDQLLFDYQFEKKDCVELFKGLIKFDTYAFVNFIFKKFYHSEGN